MSYSRTLRHDGEILCLGGIAYQILGTAGSGGSSVVYHAAYRDGLNTEQEHQVFIKELYPYDSMGRIYRDNEGRICWTEDAEERVEKSRKRFRLGNQVNLELLKKLPSQMSGNFNSFEAYGTYYSVLTVHGGITLDELLRQNRGIGTLREAAVITLKILDALEGFHQNGLLHLDISPDNILLLPEQAMLIDYNSVWKMEDIRAGGFTFSRKAGYSPSEIRLRNISCIGCSTDLYSVCAVFYQMITGSVLTDHEMNIRHMMGRLCSGLDIFRDVPCSAVFKAIRIMIRGLHVLSRKRYQDISSMRRNIEDMIDCIDGKGVSHSALWESSRILYKRTQDTGNPYLFQNIFLSDSGNISLWELGKVLDSGHNILLKGPGGMGKTRLLRELWKNGILDYHEDNPVVYYIPLKDYQETQGEAGYIRKYILSQLCFSAGQNRTEDLLHELERLFDRSNGTHVNIILLLDGLNEAGTHREKLLREIEDLAARPGTGVLVTERTHEVQKYALMMFQTAELLPLPPETVKIQLEATGIPVPQKKDLKELLSNPMMLELYESVISMEEDNRTKDGGKQAIHCADDLVRLYLENLCTTQLRIDAGNESMQLCHQYILTHLLPAVALVMTRKKCTLLSFRQMYQIVRQNYRNLKKKGFGKKFLNYLGKSRIMSGDLSEMEWFDFAVVEQLDGNLGLITKNHNGYYRLIHDNFQPYLAKRGMDNLKKIYRCRINILIAFTAGIIVWDTAGPAHFRHVKNSSLSTAYYLDIKEVYDVPTGIYPVEEKNLPLMNSYWTIRTRENKTISGTRYRKGIVIGSFIISGDTPELDCFFQNPFYYNDRIAYQSAAIARTSGDVMYSYGAEFYQSEDGVYRVCSYTTDGMPDNLPLQSVTPYYSDYDGVQDDVVRVKEYYTEEGYEDSCMFLNSFTDVDSYSEDEHGVAGLGFGYDEIGRKTALYYLNKDRRRIAAGDIFKLEYVYDEKGDMVENAYRDMYNQRIEGNEGWSYVKSSYDQWHNLTNVRYYNRYGMAVKGPEGAECLEYRYEDGNVTNVSYLNGSGKLRKNYNGYAAEEITYDHGYSIRQRCLDETGKPCINNMGFSMRTLELWYDEENKKYYPSLVRYLDADGSLCMTEEDYAAVRYDYTENGTLRRITMLDTDGRPCDPSEGYSVIEGKDPIEYSGFQSVICYDENRREVDRMTAATKEGLYLNWR